MNLLIVILVILVLPFPVQWISFRIQPFKFMGAVINCFLLGLGINFLLPPDFIEEGQKAILSGMLVPVGIGCMLFCTDVFQWLKVSLKVMLGFVLAMISVLVTVMVVFYFYRHLVQEPEVIGGMLTGSYIGGTPNMAAIHAALKQPLDLYNTMFICDIIASSIYLFFIFVFAKRLLRFVLPAFNKEDHGHGKLDAVKDPSEDFYKLNTGLRIKYTLITLGLSALCTLVSLGFLWLIQGDLENPDLTWLFIILTLLGVGMSFIKKIRQLPGNFETGDYIFCMFFLACGLFANIQGIFGRDADQFVNGDYLALTLMILFGSVLIHILLCMIFRIDRDTMIITSVAGIMSPPFIPSVSSNLKNRELLVPGITVGIIGLAAGNILGLTVTELLYRWF